MIKPFNFTTEYIESQSKETKKSHPVVTSSIEKAVKFMLPVGGLVLDTLGINDPSNNFEKFGDVEVKDFFSKIIPALRLPYDAINFEFFRESGEKTIIHATQTEDKDAIFFIVFTLAKDYPFWLTLPFAFRITKDYEMKADEVKSLDVDSPLNSYFKSRKEGYTFLYTYVILDFLSAINCNNIKREFIPAPKFINSKRKAKGKALFSDYHVLTLDLSKTKVVSTGEKREGSHTPKRQHLRRGHVRKLSTGQTTWVSQCTVGKAENGFLTKDYWVRN